MTATHQTRPRPAYLSNPAASIFSVPVPSAGGHMGVARGARAVGPPGPHPRRRIHGSRPPQHRPIRSGWSSCSPVARPPGWPRRLHEEIVSITTIGGGL